VERVSGLPFDRVVQFFAMGMLMNVAAAMDLPAVDERWTSWCPKTGGEDGVRSWEAVTEAALERPVPAQPGSTR